MGLLVGQPLLQGLKANRFALLSKEGRNIRKRSRVMESVMNGKGNHCQPWKRRMEGAVGVAVVE
jgi:hypothetical protein